MVDLTQPASAAEFIAAGADPATAESLATQANLMAGRVGTRDEQIAFRMSVRDPVPLQQPAPLPGVAPAAATASVEAHSQGQFDNHLAEVYAPPASALDYQIPAGTGELSDEAMAADRALVQTLYADRMPRTIGNAILKDLSLGRPTQKSAETTAALKGWVDQLLTRAQADPALKQYTTGMSAQLLLATLSPETVVALMPWVQFRAGKR